MQRTKKSATPAFDPTGASFLFTGKLASMSRATAETRVEAIGGRVASGVRKDLGVLVIGDEGSPLYGAGKIGDKQRKVESLNAAGAKIRVISETDFLALAGAANTIPGELPSVSLITQPKDAWSPAICGGIEHAGCLYLVGGLGSNLVLKSTDGRTLVEVKSTGGGLRGIVVDGDRVWLAGEYGSLWHSTKGFSKGVSIETATSSCLHGLAMGDDGAVWVGGDGGFLARSTDGKTFKRVPKVTGDIGKIVRSSLGVLIPSSAGLWIGRGAKVTKLGLTKATNQAIVTRAGTIVAVGPKNAIHRSTDGGKTFQAAKVPAFKPIVIKTKLQKPSWVPQGNALNVIAELADGRIAVGGDQGVVLVSVDDGARFTAIPHKQTDAAFWGAVPAFGAVFLGGGNYTVVRVGEPTGNRRPR